MLDIHANKIIANKFVGEFENNNDGISIGMIIPYSGNNEIPNGFLLCNGESIRKDTYIDLFNVIGTVYGSIDEEHFNLPDLVGRFIEGAENAGVYKEAGLPNIEGGFGQATQIPTSGAFYRGGHLTNNINNQSTIGTIGISIDASRSSPIYGNSDTVQPPSITVRYIIKAFAGVNTSTTDLNISLLANDKANKDLNNLTENGRKAFFPSSTYLDITNLTEFTPPSNGFVVACKSINANGSITIQQEQMINRVYTNTATSSTGLVVQMPVVAKELVTITYTNCNMTTGYARFVYVNNEI